MHYSRFCAFVAVSLTLSCVSFGQAASPAVPQSEPSQSQGLDYVLGPEDVFSVTVLRHPEFSGDYLVPQTGLVQLQAVGELNVTGLNLATLQTKILSKLRERLRNPEVSVSLKLARLQRVYVLGAVTLPGIKDWKAGWGFAECLSAAGGLLPTVQVSDCTAIIEKVRVGEEKQRVEVPLSSALNGLTAEDIAKGVKPTDLIPKPGDVIRIQTIETIPVYVSGKVLKPGPLLLRKDAAGVMQAIAQAEGVIPGAAVANIRIEHTDGTSEIVDLSSLLNKDSVLEAGQAAGTAPKPAVANPRLRSGDLVVVPELLDKFAILGYVSKPNFYSLPSGRNITLAQAVAMAEGPNQRGRISRVGLVRVIDGKDVRKVYDLGKYLNGRDDTQNPLIRPGDVIYVPESPRVEITQILSGISSTAIFFNAMRR